MSKQKSKIISILLLASMAVSMLSGCAGSVTGNSEQPQTNSASSLTSDSGSSEENSTVENSAESSTDEFLDEGSLVQSKKSSDEFEYDVYTNHIAITKYTGKSLKVKIPEEIDGLSVTELYSREDSQGIVSSSVTSVELPDTILWIGKNAFYKSQAKSINIPDSVRLIGKRAFTDCKNLEGIKLPSKLTTIGEYAFCNCSAENAFDEKLIIPDGVTEIPEGAFKATFDSLTPNFKELVIPDSVTLIQDRSFENCKYLETITFGKGVTEIGADVFKSCESLKSLTIPENIKKINEQAFFGCGLESFTLPEGIELTDGIFASNKNLEKAVIPKGVTYFESKWADSPGRFLFSGCKNLKSVEIKSEEVPTDIFEKDSKLREVKLSNDVIKINRNAFGIERSYGDTTELSLHIPESVEVIEDIGAPKDVTVIYGKKGSEAEKYAQKNEYKFVQE